MVQTSWSDVVKQFEHSVFQKRVKDGGIEHTVSIAYSPKSNNKADRLIIIFPGTATPLS